MWYTSMNSAADLENKTYPVNLKRMLLELVWSSAIEDGKHNASMVHMLSVKGQQPMVPS